MRDFALRVRAKVAPKRVLAERLLLGGEGGFRAARYAVLVDEPLRPSTLLADGPHVRLLQQYLEHGDAIFGPKTFEATEYYRNALQAMNATGHYFGVIDEDGIIQVARGFVERFRTDKNDSGAHGLRRGQTPNGVPVRVCPVKHSDCFEIVDGHHRLAIQFVRGEREMRVVRAGRAVLTPLQRRLLDVSWTKGRRELYQPIEAPELRHWRLVRRCSDRLGLMTSFLSRNDLIPPECRTYLDVASSYGWFVWQMSKFGLEAWGVEQDPVAASIGYHVYGIDRQRIVSQDCVRFLKTTEQAYDVVSCLSLLHHFALGRTALSAEDMLRLLDRATKHVLFFETGQATESWFQDLLPQWTPDFIERWLLKHSSFAHVLRLGRDRDDVPPFHANYGRTLFACMREPGRFSKAESTSINTCFPS